MRANINLRTKLLLQFLFVGITPLAIISFLAYFLASKSLEESAFEKLESVKELKKAAVERYFQEIKNNIVTFSESKMIVDASKNFKEKFHSYTEEIKEINIPEMKKNLLKYYSGPFSSEFRRQNNDKDPNIIDTIEQLDDVGIAIQHNYIQSNYHPLGSKHLLDYSEDGTSYSKIHKNIHPIVKSYLERFGFYDIFIVDIDTGHIIYSVFKELDFGTSLIDGPYKGTNFAKAFNSVKENSDKNFVKLVDYKIYKPSYNFPASFIATPIYEGDKKIAVAIFQMPIDRLNKIMNQKNGMGETGETFLVGSDHLLRSNTLLDKENRNVGNSFKNPNTARIDDPNIEKAISGQSGKEIGQNYLDHEVLLSYAPIKLIGLTWAIYAEVGSKEAFEPVIKLRNWLLIIASITILLCLLTGTIIGKNIANPILNVATELDENSKQVASASDGMADSSNLLSELSAQQASSIEETAASIEQISAMVKNNVEQAENSSTLSTKVKEVADSGNNSMKELVNSMKEIIESNQKIQELVKVIGEIGEKTSVIDEIVFQTKLLSFNASVEAERAGEHGRGFAVVAQEVGNLAKMSGKAASEISQMVKSSVKNAEIITSENKIKVESGNNLVHETAKYLEEIRKNAEILLTKADQIVNSSKEQSEGVTQINEAMNQLDQATQQNSATAEETASSSKKLATQAVQLKENVDNLVKQVEGTSGLPDRNGSIKNNTPYNKLSKENKIDVISINSSKKTSNKYSGTLLKKASGDELDSDSNDDSWEKL